LGDGEEDEEQGKNEKKGVGRGALRKNELKRSRPGGKN